MRAWTRKRQSYPYMGLVRPLGLHGIEAAGNSRQSAH
jgi:hypothetical protein